MDKPWDSYDFHNDNPDGMAQNYDEMTPVDRGVYGQNASGATGGFHASRIDPTSHTPDGPQDQASLSIQETDEAFEGRTGFPSTIWNGLSASAPLSTPGGWLFDNSEPPSTNFDCAGMNGPTWDEEQYVGDRTDLQMPLVNQSSPTSPGTALVWEQPIARAEPWNALHMDPSMEISVQMAAHRTSVSSMGHQSDLYSQGGVSSGSNVKATQTPGTSDDLIQPCMRDGMSTAQQQPFSTQTPVPYLQLPGYPRYLSPYGDRNVMSPGNGSNAGLSSNSRSPSGRSLILGGMSPDMPPLPPPVLIQNGPEPPSPSAQCKHRGCSQVYHGPYAQGSMHRHMRLKHSGKPERQFTCDARGCDRAFKRQDARLKHMRRKHPELGTAEAQPRGKLSERPGRADATRRYSSAASNLSDAGMYDM